MFSRALLKLRIVNDVSKLFIMEPSYRKKEHLSRVLDGTCFGIDPGSTRPRFGLHRALMRLNAGSTPYGGPRYPVLTAILFGCLAVFRYAGLLN